MEQDNNKRQGADRRGQNDDRRFEERVAAATDQSTDDQFLSKFETDTDKRLTRFVGVSLILMLCVGAYFTIMEIVIPEIMAMVNDTLTATASFEKKKEKEKKKKKEKVKPRKKRGGGGQKRGKKKHKNINGVGVLKLLTSKSKSSSHTAYDLMQSKFKDIDKSLDKIAALKTTGQTRLSGRKGANNAGFNDGFASGGTGGIDDMLGGLLGGDDMRVGVSAKGKLRAPSASEIDMGSGGSRRSAASILRVVRQHMPGLRHTYNKHLKKNPGFSGKIKLKFLIAPSGKTISVNIAGSTTGVSAFDAEVKNKVRRWRFEPITAKGNDTVIIPLTFSE